MYTHHDLYVYYRIRGHADLRYPYCTQAPIDSEVEFACGRRGGGGGAYAVKASG